MELPETDRQYVIGSLIGSKFAFEMWYRDARLYMYHTRRQSSEPVTAAIYSTGEDHPIILEGHVAGPFEFLRALEQSHV